jgi:hypothetical protein
VQLLHLAKVLLRRLLTESGRRAKAFRDGLGEAGRAKEARGLLLLKEWLSPEQLVQHEADGYFDVTGCDSGKRYRIHHGIAMNINEIDPAGVPRTGWCFVPSAHLVAGDVMLAQKIALETNERDALAVARSFPLNRLA